MYLASYLLNISTNLMKFDTLSHDTGVVCYNPNMIFC